MTKSFSLTLVLLIAILLMGCSPKQQEIVVAKVGEMPITLADYEKLYIKSNSNKEAAANSTQEEREKFLELMTRFRLKLADAYRQGVHKRPEIIQEIAQYKGSLVASFLTERLVTQPGIKKLYEDRKEETRARHILLNLPAGVSTAESAKVHETAYELIRLLKAGAPFDSLAVANSTDPSVAQNKGDLYYFTSGQMVPEFEDAVAAMKIGEISTHPVRTQFGLHIIQIVDRKPSPGEVLCSHIMVRFQNQDPSPEDTLESYAKIKAIRDSVAMGIDFAELARRHSEDPGSASRGGDLGWFTRRRWIQSFDEVALSLSPGQVSGIVRTVYGYHLIKCYDRRSPKTFEESQRELQQLYQQTRFQDDKDKFLARLKHETGFRLEESVVEQFIATLDTNTSTRDTDWASGIPDDLGVTPMIKFGERSVSVDSVVGLIKNRPDLTAVPLRAASVRSTIDKIAEQLVFEVKGEALERTSPEFAAIMKEYVDGILLYQIEQDQVWNRVTVTDSALQAYFEAHREKFQFPDRVAFTAISLTSDSIAQMAHTLLKSGKTFQGIASMDSVRMSEPIAFEVHFAANSPKVSQATEKVLATIASRLKKDASLSAFTTAHVDLDSKEERSQKLADRRLQAIKSVLMNKYNIEDRQLMTNSRPMVKSAVSTMSEKEYKKLESKVNIDLTGRRQWVIGGVESLVQPVTTDERSERASGLAEGAYSEPFRYKSGYTIVLLNKREPARLKTFEEAGTEISSSFQEYESKRLEREWLENLRKIYPIVEYRDALKHAFADIAATP